MPETGCTRCPTRACILPPAAVLALLVVSFLLFIDGLVHMARQIDPVPLHRHRACTAGVVRQALQTGDAAL